MKVRNVFSTKYATGVRLIRAETLHEQNDIAHCLSVEKKVFSRPPRPPYFSSLSLSLSLGKRRGNDRDARNIFVGVEREK